jgi:hypothetical protein
MIHNRILDFEPLQFEEWTISEEVETIEILYTSFVDIVTVIYYCS